MAKLDELIEELKILARRERVYNYPNKKVIEDGTADEKVTYNSFAAILKRTRYNFRASRADLFPKLLAEKGLDEGIRGWLEEMQEIDKKTEKEGVTGEDKIAGKNSRARRYGAILRKVARAVDEETHTQQYDLHERSYHEKKGKEPTERGPRSAA